MSRARWTVRGRVQGVMFRASARARAEQLGLTCQAWNRDDAAVDVVAEGEAEALDELGRWLHRGPPLAHVDSVQRLPA